MATTLDLAEIGTLLGPPTDLMVRRDGDRDLTFEGWVIGDGKQTTNARRTIHVVIYATVSGKFVTEVRRSHGGTGVQYAAAVHGRADYALAWLKADNDGQLGTASKDSWEQACQAFPPLQEFLTERID